MRTVLTPGDVSPNIADIVADLRRVVLDIAHAINTDEDLIEVAAVALDATGGVATHPLLGAAVHTDTTSASPALNSIIRASATKWEAFVGGTADQVLTINSGATDLEWKKLLAANMSLVTGTGNTFVLNTGPTITTPILVLPTISSFSLAQHDHEGGVGGGLLDAGAVFNAGEVPVGRGGTGADLAATGGVNQFVKQLSVGGDFSVAVITAADLTGIMALTDLSDVTSKQGSGTVVVMATSPTITTPTLTTPTIVSGQFGSMDHTHENAGRLESSTRRTSLTPVSCQPIAVGRITGTGPSTR